LLPCYLGVRVDAVENLPQIERSTSNERLSGRMCPGDCRRRCTWCVGRAHVASNMRYFGGSNW